MKIYIACHQCVTAELVEHGEVRAPSAMSVEMNDSGVFEIECAEGHRTVVTHQNHKYEILFEMGAMAFLDGYYREAVSSFAVSLERYMEFCCFVLLLDSDTDFSAIQETWKYVSRQSERQLGAFVFLYLQKFGSPPTFLKELSVRMAFRNKVVHGGRIPARRETREFAEWTMKTIFEIDGGLKNSCKESRERAVALDMSTRRRSASKSKHNTTMYWGMILSTEKTWDAALVDLSQRRDLYEGNTAS